MVPAPANDSHGLPEQWALQLGVFSARANALDVRERAEKAGFHALVQPVGKGAGARYRVYVAPKLDRAAVLRLAPDVQRRALCTRAADLGFSNRACRDGACGVAR